MERGAETPNQKKMMATIEAAKTRGSQREKEKARVEKTHKRRGSQMGTAPEDLRA